MNYKKHYDLLIKRAKTRQLTGYVERHHIVPRCMGGKNEKSNLVELTPEEHYVAHQLLVKMYPNNDSLVYAANKMTVSSNSQKRSNKKYGWLKRKHQNLCKKRVGDKNPSYGRSWYYCPNTLKNGKFLKEDIPTGWVKGRIQNEEKYIKKLKEICKKEKKHQERIELAQQLFNMFCQGKYKSIQNFIDDGNSSFSNEALRRLWKKYIPEYSKNSSQGRSFKISG
jgi:hypothetical protein